MPEASELASALNRAHEENPVRSRMEHMGETVQATGQVYQVHEDGTVALQSGRSRSTHTILCQFDDLDLVAELDRGEKVTFTGTVGSARRRKDRTGRARLNGCSTTAGERR